MRILAKWTLTLMLITCAARLSAYTIPYEIWMGSYLGEKKIGYLSLKIDKGEYDGVPGYRIGSVMNNRLTVLGTDLTQLVSTVVRTDANYVPLVEDFSMSSGGKTTKVRAVFKKDFVDCMISAGSGFSSKSIPIPPGANLVGDAMFAIMDPSPKIGKEYSLCYFNPLTLAVENLSVKVERREQVTVGEKKYDTVVLKNVTPMGEMTIWQEPGGDIVKVKAIMGITMIRQDREEALTGVGGGAPEDFAVLTSVKTDRDIPDPRRCRKLDIVLDGLDSKAMAITDSRQKTTPLADKAGAVRFQISARSFGATKSVSLPVDESRYREYLASTPYVDCDLKAIKEQVKSVVEGETNAYNAACKIRSWIHANLRTRADIGITRSASDVLKSKEGVCRDYATLFAGLARSARIPTRIASGLVYTEGGFYYHAWVECFVGEWVPFDATLSTDFVDATHIKLAEGDATSMFGLAKVIGNLKVEVKDFK